MFSAGAGETVSGATGGVTATGVLDGATFEVEACAASSFSTRSWRLLISLSNSARSASLSGTFSTGDFGAGGGPFSGVAGPCDCATAFDRSPTTTPMSNAARTSDACRTALPYELEKESEPLPFFLTGLFSSL